MHNCLRIVTESHLAVNNSVYRQLYKVGSQHQGSPFCVHYIPYIHIVNPVVTLNCSSTIVQEDKQVSCTCTETANTFILATTTLFYGTANVSSALQHITAAITGNRYTSEIICQAQLPEGTKTNKTQSLNVYFASAILSFDVNGTSEQIIIERNSTVSFSCQAEGNPSPSLSLRKNGTELQQFRDPTRNFNLMLTYNMNMSKCLDTGVYMCRAGNGLTTTSKAVTVYVKCMQQFTNPDNLRQINKGRVNGTVSINLSVFGYPEPNVTLNSSKYTISSDAYNLTYIKQEPPYGIVSLMINIENANFFQNYSLNINNVKSQLTHSFEIVEGDPETPGPENDSSPDQDIGAIVGGIVAAVLVIVVIAAAIFLWKRKGVPCKPKDHQYANTSVDALNRSDAPGAPRKQEDHQYGNTIMHTPNKNEESGAPSKQKDDQYTSRLIRTPFDYNEPGESTEAQAPENPHYEEIIHFQTDVPDKPVYYTNQISNIQHAEVEYQNTV